MTGQNWELPLAQDDAPRADSSSNPGAEKRWRDLVVVHPATDLFPRLTNAELIELGNDIKQNGLKHPIVLWTPPEALRPACGSDYLLDGINRLAAMELVGMDIVGENGKWLVDTTMLSGNLDPVEYVVSANLYRRHLTQTQKRKLTEKLLKANPARSDNATAKLAKVSDKTVTAVRQQLEATSEIPKLDKTTGADGKIRAARRSTPQGASKPKVSAGQLRDTAISGFSKLLHQHPVDALDDLTRLLRGEQARIAELPRKKRVQLAREYLRALGLSVDDLSPDEVA